MFVMDVCDLFTWSGGGGERCGFVVLEESRKSPERSGGGGACLWRLVTNVSEFRLSLLIFSEIGCTHHTHFWFDGLIHSPLNIFQIHTLNFFITCTLFDYTY
jgi:hypothetical protein